MDKALGPDGGAGYAPGTTPQSRQHLALFSPSAHSGCPTDPWECRQGRPMAKTALSVPLQRRFTPVHAGAFTFGAAPQTAAPAPATASTLAAASSPAQGSTQQGGATAQTVQGSGGGQAPTPSGFGAFPAGFGAPRPAHPLSKDAASKPGLGARPQLPAFGANASPPLQFGPPGHGPPSPFVYPPTQPADRPSFTAQIAPAPGASKEPANPFGAAPVKQSTFGFGMPLFGTPDPSISARNLGGPATHTAAPKDGTIQNVFAAARASFFGAPGPASAPTFGAPASAPTFGGPASAPAFGAPRSAPTFGGPAGAPAFGAPASAPAFAGPASAPAFGAAGLSNVGATLLAQAGAPFGAPYQDGPPRW